MKCKVERKSPQMHGGVLTAGDLCTIDNKGLNTEEIRQEFGGGTYHISIIGPRATKTGPRIMRLSHKPLVIPGPPRVDNLGTLGQEQPPPASSRSSASADPLAKIVDTSMSHLQRRVDSAGQQSAQAMQMIGAQFSEATQMKAAAADKMLQEKDRLLQMELKSAQQRVDDALAEANRAREEKDKALGEARRAAERIEVERRAMEDSFSKKLDGVHDNNNTLLSTLLPQAQQSAQNQINLMMSMFESRLTAAESSYQSRLENLEQSYQNRMSAQADLFKSQMESAKQLSHGQIQHLQLELQTARAEKAQVNADLESTRNRLMEEISKINKSSDPEQQIIKLGGLLETVKSIGGIGGSDEEKETKTGNALIDAITSNLGKVTEIVPHVTQAWTAKSQADAMQAQAMLQQQQQYQHPQQAQQVQQQVQQQMQHPMQHPQAPAPQAPEQAQTRQLPAPQQHRAAPRAKRRAPQQQAKPKPQEKIPREDLDQAVVYINAALTSNPDISPSDFARMVTSAVPNEMLRILSRPKAEYVVDDLEKKGILHGAVSTDAGKVFLIAVLDHLRSNL
jgi:hypothetical protein